MEPFSAPLKVMIADDHKLFMDGVESLLDSVNHIHLVAKLPNGDALLTALPTESVDIVIIDLSMPGLKTEELIKRIKQHSEHIKIIALTMHSDPYLAKRLLNQGLSGYVLKDEAFEDLIQAIQQACEGKQFLSLSLDTSIQHCDNHAEQLLTEREETVLIEVSKGQSNKEIARVLDISERTVRFHLKNCCQKLNAQGRTDAVTIAQKRRLILL